MVPDCNEGTLFMLFEYFSPVPFNIPRHPAPVATSIDIDIPGLHETISECLHGKVTVRDVRSGGEWWCVCCWRVFARAEVSSDELQWVGAIRDF